MVRKRKVFSFHDDSDSEFEEKESVVKKKSPSLNPIEKYLLEKEEPKSKKIKKERDDERTVNTRSSKQITEFKIEEESEGESEKEEEEEILSDESFSGFISDSDKSDDESKNKRKSNKDKLTKKKELSDSESTIETPIPEEKQTISYLNLSNFSPVVQPPKTNFKTQQTPPQTPSYLLGQYSPMSNYSNFQLQGFKPRESRKGRIPPPTQIHNHQNGNLSMPFRSNMLLNSYNQSPIPIPTTTTTTNLHRQYHPQINNSNVWSTQKIDDSVQLSSFKNTNHTIPFELPPIRNEGSSISTPIDLDDEVDNEQKEDNDIDMNFLKQLQEKQNKKKMNPFSLENLLSDD
eukprot:gene10945-3651_t